MEDIRQILEEQRKFSAMSLDFRLDSLRALFSEIKAREPEICAALRKDLGKCEFEAVATETSVVLEELSMMIKHLPDYVQRKRVGTSLLNFCSKGYIYPEPLGNVLIFSAWNYPFQLMISPLIGAVAAGNRVILKPAEQAEATAGIIESIVKKVFQPAHVHVFNGGVDVAIELLKEKFDYIFYTGGAAGGKAVMRAAAENLTPLTLELGGKSPCIVDSDVKVNLAAKRIAWGKFLNAGQTCVAPDYVYVHTSVKKAFTDRLLYWIKHFYTEDPSTSEDYPHIINEKHFDRLLKLMGSGALLCGGNFNKSRLYIAPTVVDGVTWSDPVMQEEIFGPILPLLQFTNINEVLSQIKARPKPLALYYFGKHNWEQVLEETSSGGVCINETVMHLLNPEMPFGGVGGSGFGAYHGKYSFDTFTHYKPVMVKSTTVDLPMRYPPDLNKNLKMLKFVSK